MPLSAFQLKNRLKVLRAERDWTQAYRWRLRSPAYLPRRSKQFLYPKQNKKEKAPDAG